MKKVVFLFILMFILTLVACKKDVTPAELNILNGDFESEMTDSWVGWTKEGNSFSARGVVMTSTMYEIDVDKTGDYWFNGLEGGTQPMVGKLISNQFELTGTGYVAFKMGAAKNPDIHVDFYVEGTDAAVASITNDDFNEPYITVQLMRKLVDLSDYLNQIVWIEVVDNDTSDDFGFVNLDDFVVVLTQQELTGYQTERSDQLVAYAEPVFEEDETSTTIQNGGFETGDLSGWKILSGSAFTNAAIAPTTQIYWTDSKIYGWGDYYLDGNNNTAISESFTGSIRSSKFTLDGDGWISFMIGAAPTLAYVSINDGTTGEELITVQNPTFNDPKLPLTLRRVYVDASEYLGDVLYISVVDNNGGSGFAFITVDDFRVSLTDQDVQDLMLEQYQVVMAETEDNGFGQLAALKAYYNNYDYPFELATLKFDELITNKVLPGNATEDLTVYLDEASASFGSMNIDIAIDRVVFGESEFTTGFDSFDMSLEGNYVVYYTATYGDETIENSFIIQVASNTNVVNGDFELGDLTGWTLVDGTISLENAIIGASSFWGEAIAYNQGGDFHFDGWAATGVESEGYALQSSNFVLSGTGFISFKLGGNAAYLKVYTTAGDQLIGYYTNPLFADINFPYLGQGSRLATMTRYFADLSAYVGEELYVVFGDDSAISGWAVAFVDDINVYYPEQPILTYDEVNESGDQSATVIQLTHEQAINVFVINGGFESGDLLGWSSTFVDNPVISATSYWGEQLPYNQAGSYHVDGWNTGVAEAEGWTLTSSNFMLMGSGYISVRMAGAAAVTKVYLADGTQIGEYVQTRFNDANFPNVDLGGSWADMGTYVIDLTAYLGQELYVELCDVVIVGGWAHAWFDELITYYETAPDWTISGDEVTLYAPTERNYTIPWQLAVNSLT